jgi:hypothetical protein
MVLFVKKVLLKKTFSKLKIYLSDLRNFKFVSTNLLIKQTFCKNKINFSISGKFYNKCLFRSICTIDIPIHWLIL